MCLPRSSSKDSSSGGCWLPGMEQLFDGLFWILDPRAVLAIVLLCFELLQEAETWRSRRVPRSAVLGHAETLLAAIRHSITNEKLYGSFLAPGSCHRSQASLRLAESTRIALVVKRREAGTVGARAQCCNAAKVTANQFSPADGAGE